ncbi:DNA alkylation repair protein [Polyangium sp. y55x31]|uniref:DNA alkylation repair protein n=1 Tax=Polyangium sp. y55x31 TaxID=3042688 RepID=UPI002482EF40|nr:DNA alkylation repair protein [Polyangium sp. y55x31]MDI1481981.1 DNA alkylation repair protein [Polyangium sp. y55x31]
MDLDTVLSTLREKGKPNTAKIYARHGVKDPTFGVSYGDLEKLVKTIKQNHVLALALWATGNHDARILATKIADPEAFSHDELDAWLAVALDYVIEGAVATLAARRKDALAIGLRWIDLPGEFASTAGWFVLSGVAARGELPEKEAARLLKRIEKKIHGSQNRTRYGMNNALISIGGYIEPLRAQALEAARVIGKVEVDHGETNCKTPDATEYIAKMVAHAAKRAGGAKPAATKKAEKPTAAAKATKAAPAKKAAAKKAPAKKAKAS